MSPRLIEPIVLCFLIYKNQVLLIKRAPAKKVYPGKWDGIGGKIEPGETPLHACCREYLEETGLSLSRPSCCAVINVLDHQHGVERLVFVFRADAFSGTQLHQSVEGQLDWINTTRLDALDLIPDIPLYLEIVTRASPQLIFGRLEFDRQGCLITPVISDESSSCD